MRELGYKQRERHWNLPCLWQSASLDGPPWEPAYLWVLWTNSQGMIPHWCISKRKRGEPGWHLILVLLSYKSILHCLICEMELGSSSISPLPYGTRSSFVNREFWREDQWRRKGIPFPDCSVFHSMGSWVCGFFSAHLLQQHPGLLQHPGPALLWLLQQQDSVARTSSSTPCSCSAQWPVAPVTNSFLQHSAMSLARYFPVTSFPSTYRGKTSSNLCAGAAP